MPRRSQSGVCRALRVAVVMLAHLEDRVGAGGGTRTRRPLRAPHFERGAFANFATPARAYDTTTRPCILWGAPDFTAVDNALQPVKLSQAKGKVIVLSAVPSLDTPVCDTETRKFNQEAGKLGANVEVWTVSMDLPFAQKRWCGAAGVTAVKTLSDFRERSFAQNYGVLVKEGPLAGLTARAVFVVGKDGKVKHAEYVKEITTEPNYDAALSAARQAAAG